MTSRQRFHETMRFGNPDRVPYFEEGIRKEIEEKVPPLIASGGFIPIADGRVRKNIPFENYVYYRRLLEQIINNNR